MEFYLLFVKLLLVLSIIVAVIECKELERRDVHHRIIVKSARKPRSHRNRPKHHHHHHHHKSHAKHSDEKDYGSFEDSSAYFEGDASPEKTYEQIINYKPPRHYSHSTANPFSSSIGFEETKPEFFKDEWTPLVQTEIPSSVSHKKQHTRTHHYSSHENYHRPANTNKRKHKTHKYSKSRSSSSNSPIFPEIELTTSFPTKVPFTDYYETSGFPSFPAVQSNSKLTQKTFDSSQSPVIPSNSGIFVTPPFLQYLEKNPGYQVQESQKEEVTERSHNSFQILAPALAAANVQLAEDIKNQETSTVHDDVYGQQTKRPTIRSRGKVRAKHIS